VTGMAPLGDPFGCFCKGGFAPIVGAADGPLSGLSFAVKDLIDTAGSVTGAGNPDWKRTHGIASANAPCVQKLLDAGASVAGRTITDELAFSLEGENYFEGTPVNPAAQDRLPGGSSSGSAVAAAGGLVDFAVGTDTGGSVRVPAAFCGIYGFRPTHGAVPLDGVVPFAPSLDTVGWFARDVAVLSRVGRVLLADRAPASISKVLIAKDAFALADQDVSAVLMSAVELLGLPVHAVEAAPFPIKELAKCYQHIQAADIRAAQGQWLMETKPVFGPNIAPRFAGIWASSPNEIAEAKLARDQLGQHVRSLFQAHPGAALALPAAPCFALRRGLDSDALAYFYAKALAIGGLASLCGLPQISIPIRGEKGLAGGLGLVGAHWSDLDLLNFSLTLAGSLS
jgi:amidase